MPHALEGFLLVGERDGRACPEAGDRPPVRWRRRAGRLHSPPAPTPFARGGWRCRRARAGLQ
eukprot:3946603-Lingulodinium_polyedra.AAC.1